MQEYGVRYAKNNLPKLLKMLPFVITHHKVPVAVITKPDLGVIKAEREYHSLVDNQPVKDTTPVIPSVSVKEVKQVAKKVKKPLPPNPLIETFPVVETVEHVLVNKEDVKRVLPEVISKKSVAEEEPVDGICRHGYGKGFCFVAYCPYYKGDS